VPELDASLERRLDFGSLELSPPVISLDEAGAQAPLPERMPDRAARPLVVGTVPRARVAVTRETCRSYLLDRDFEPVPATFENSQHVWQRGQADLGAIAPRLAKAAEGADPVALISGPRSGYWHWWVDTLSRIWLLEEVGGEVGSLPLAFGPMEFDFQPESVEALGIGHRIRQVEPGVTRFPAVTYATSIAAGASRYPSPRLADYARWLQERLGLGRTGGGRRLFVSRGDAGWRRVANEDELAGVLEERGFEIVECARLPLARQIELFAEAEIVVGPHGGGMTNLLFSPPGTKVLELFSVTAAQGDSNYRVIASHLGQPYARLLGEIVGEGRSAHDLDMRIDPRLLERTLDALEAAPPDA
jgi:capsular polysaccharide biosynthesis protein